MSTWPRFRTPPFASPLSLLSGSRSCCALLFLLLALSAGPKMSWAGPLFEAPFTSYDMGHTFAPGFAVGDVNGDGRFDLVAVSEPFGFNGFTVRLGNGDGTFGPRIDHDLQNGFSQALILADLNQDSKLDVALTNAYAVVVLFGNGDGTFQQGPSITAMYGPDWPRAVDMNGDHILDIVFRREVAYQVYSVSVILGTGNGAFGPVTDFALSGSEAPLGLAVGDLNADHRADAVVPTRDGPTKILLGNGDGTFGPETDDPGHNGRSIVLTDMNHDDRLDAVMPVYPDTVIIMLGLGNGHFGPATPFSAGSSVKEAIVGDLDSDGNADVMVTNENTGTVSVLRGSGDGTLGPPAEFEGGSGTMALGDFNDDRHPDLALRNFTTVSIMLGNGDATFGMGRGFSGIPYSFKRIVANDVNGDTRPDLLISGYYAIGIYLGGGDGTFTQGNVLTEPGGGIGMEAIAVGDFNEDHHTDLAVSSGYTFVRIWFGNGDGSFDIGQALPVSNYSRAPAVADLNGDSHDDLVVPVDGGMVSVFFGVGDGTFGTRHDFASGDGPRAVAVGDVNGDTFPDLVTTGGYTSVLLNDGAGGFGGHTDYLRYDYPAASLVLARLNQDAALDVVVDGTTAMFGNGDGTFGAPAAVNPNFGGDQPLSFAAVDVNADGVTDIATTGSLSCCIIGVHEGASVLLGNGDGTFQPPLNFGGGVGATSLIAADLDGNGSPDLAVTNYLSYSVGIFLNTTRTNAAPDCGRAAASVTSLWPPDHRFEPISILGVTDPDGDPVTISVTSVTQDEPLLTGGRGGSEGGPHHGGGRRGGNRGGGDPRLAAVSSTPDEDQIQSEGEGGSSHHGNEDAVCTDAILLDNGQVKLRRERLGKGNGRVYVIAFTARDAAGNECSGAVQVCVPHSNSRHGTCVDDGQTVNSLGSCWRRLALPDAQALHDLALNPPRSNGSELMLDFGLPEDGDVLVAVFDISGRRLATLANGRERAGWHTASWSTSGVPSGIYFVRLRTASQAITKPVRVLR